MPFTCSSLGTGVWSFDRAWLSWDCCAGPTDLFVSGPVHHGAVDIAFYVQCESVDSAFYALNKIHPFVAVVLGQYVLDKLSLIQPTEEPKGESPLLFITNDIFSRPLGRGRDGSE